MADDVTPQAVLDPLTGSAVFLVATVTPGGEDEVRDLLADLPGLRRAVGFRIHDGGLGCVVGIGSRLYDRMYDGPRPAGLHPFVPLAGPVHTAPSTPGDLLFHIRAERPDLCFELAARIMNRLRAVAAVVDEVHGFRYFDRRDLLGFVDGTENPEGGDSVRAVHIGDEDPAFTGGTYVVVQKYLHDLDAWNKLAVEDQERAIGRTKSDDIEMSDDAKPADSHVALNTVTEPDGTQRQIMRYNMPFGDVGTSTFGTYFIGYTRTPDVIERMLRNMFTGTGPDAPHDRILDFSTPVTGCLFFVPSEDFLADQPAPARREQPTGGSLGIGSLRGRSTA